MAKVRKSGNLPFICRIDQPEKNTHGWYVRIRYQGAVDHTDFQGYARFFSDNKHGGKSAALDVAIQERDLVIRMWSDPDRTHLMNRAAA